jgi:hypothetical protein
MSRLIHFNVGGKMFWCYESTIKTSDRLWKLKLSTNFPDRLNSEVIFIDRSGKIFEHVLNYLRDPTYIYPKKYLSELYYYNIEYNEDIIKKGPNIDDC